MRIISSLKIATGIVILGSGIACEQHKKSTITETGTEIVQPRTPEVSDTPAETSKSVSGVVTEINNGKDGYTAKIRTTDNQVFAVTISHSNLKDPKQYKSVKVGDTLNVTGDSWMMENEQQITVRQIN